MRLFPLCLAPLFLAGCLTGHGPHFDRVCRECVDEIPARPPVLATYVVSDFAGGSHALSEEDVCDRIRHLIAAGTWDWEGYSLGHESGRVIVCHTPETHSKVKSLLADLRRHHASHYHGH